VPKGVGPEDIAVSISRPVRPSDVRDYTRLTPAATLELENEIIYFYKPAGKAPKGEPGHFAVWVCPLKAEATILGVWASTSTAKKWTTAWKKAAPERASAPTNFDAPSQGRLVLYPVS
jgi:hypothetical protein